MNHSTVVCAATGPSFTVQQAVDIALARFHGLCKVIAINDAWRLLPTADLLYACDGEWWDMHIAAVRGSGFAGELWTMDSAGAARHGLNHIIGRAGQGLAPSGGDHIYKGRNSGFQAMQLAYLQGARKIVLVGFDMQRTGGKQHFFGDHPAPLINRLPFKRCLEHFSFAAVDFELRQIEVVNASIETALQCFKRSSLEQALA